MKRICLAVLLVAVVHGSAYPADGPRKYLKRPDAWFAGDEARRVADNILSYQSDPGGWPKNLDTTAVKSAGDRKTLKPTFDNGATTDELRFLARTYGATKGERYRDAFLRGLDYVLQAQYPTGGWPQSYPAGKGYHRHITFNDSSMVRLMEFIRETYAEEVYRFVDAGRRDAHRRAFDKGIECILKCQIRVDGRRTAWCAQHDEMDFRPRPARTYELVSLSGCESVGIVRLLMSLNRPSREVVEAIDGERMARGEVRTAPASNSTVGNKIAEYRAIRFEKNPIVYPGMSGLAGDDGANINGPSLIRVPAWVNKPLGKYYLYFAHHNGKHIRLAYADALEGPWRVHPGGVLGLADAPGRGHIASPDVIADQERKEIRMYFHQPAPKGSPVPGQVSFVALSGDGLHFVARPEVLGQFYFRVFRYQGWYYAFAKNGNVDGVIYRSKNGLTAFEEGPHYVPGVRHTGMWIDHDTIYLAYTKAGDAPERILLATVNLSMDWKSWKVSEARVLLEPEKDYEGAALPLRPSSYGAVKGPVRQLRDPAIFEEDGERYLLYCVAGEQGIAIAKLKPQAGDCGTQRVQPRRVFCLSTDRVDGTGPTNAAPISHRRQIATEAPRAMAESQTGSP